MDHATKRRGSAASPEFSEIQLQQREPRRRVVEIHGLATPLLVGACGQACDLRAQSCDFAGEALVVTAQPIALGREALIVASQPIAFLDQLQARARIVALHTDGSRCKLPGRNSRRLSSGDDHVSPNADDVRIGSLRTRARPACENETASRCRSGGGWRRILGVSLLRRDAARGKPRHDIWVEGDANGHAEIVRPRGRGG